MNANDEVLGLSVWGITTRRSSSASECVVNLDQTLTRLASTKKTPPGRGRIGFCCLATQSHLFFWGGGVWRPRFAISFTFSSLTCKRNARGLLGCNKYLPAMHTAMTKNKDPQACITIGRRPNHTQAAVEFLLKSRTNKGTQESQLATISLLRHKTLTSLRF